MTEVSPDDQQDGMMFSEGNIERAQTKKRLLDDGRTGSTMGGNSASMKIMQAAGHRSAMYDNQNLAYMDQESMLSF